MSHAPLEGTEFEQAGLVPTEFAVAGVSQVVQAPGKPTSQPVDGVDMDDVDMDEQGSLAGAG